MSLNFLSFFIFPDIFPELCIPEAVPVEKLYPINTGSSSSTQDKQSDNSDVSGAANQRQQEVAVRKTNLQRRPPNRVENCDNTSKVNASNNVNPQTNNTNNNNNNNNNVVGQRRRCDQWRKWIIVSLVCLYLVITKLLARSSEAVSGSEAPRI